MHASNTRYKLRGPAVGPDQFRRNLKPTCLPVVSVSLTVR